MYVQHARDLHAIFGVGTVLDAGIAQQSIDLGSSFVVSPVFIPRVLTICLEKDIPFIPGCMTPTEIFNAWGAGASVIKTFPGRICVPGFYTDMRGPFPDIKMMPTGNVNEHTAVEYLSAGAIAIGVGKALVSDELIASGSWDLITERAKRFVEIVRGVS